MRVVSPPAQPALPPGDYVAADSATPGTYQPVVGGTFTTIRFNAFVAGTPANFDLSSSRWICPAAGEYTISVGMQADLPGNVEYYVFVYVNGIRVRDILHDRTPTAGYYGSANAVSLVLAAGDYVEARVYFDPAGGTIVGAPFRTFASFLRVR